MFSPEPFHRLLQDLSLPSAEWDEFVVKLKPHDHLKGAVLLAPGDPAKSIFLVETGVLRSYFTDEKGKELTKIFRGPGGILGPYAEILAGEATSRFYLQAVTAARVWEMSFAEFARLRDTGAVAWEKLSRRLAEMSYLEKERREWELMSLSAQENYEIFLKRFGELSEHIPQYQVASYLGISPEALNRILKSNRRS